MRILIVVCGLACATPAIGAQPPPSSPSPPQATTLLSQCSSVDETTRNLLAAGARTPARWRRWTTGTTVVTSSGQRVHVVGRLVPTPNIAAQIGDIDPTIQTMAFVEGKQNRSGLESTRPAAAGLVAPPPAPLRVACPR